MYRFSIHYTHAVRRIIYNTYYNNVLKYIILCTRGVCMCARVLYTMSLDCLRLPWYNIRSYNLPFIRLSRVKHVVVGSLQWDSIYILLLLYRVRASYAAQGRAARVFGAISDFLRSIESAGSCRLPEAFSCGRHPAEAPIGRDRNSPH